MVIKKATQAQTIAAIKSGDFSTVDAINRKAEKEAMEIFAAVAGGTFTACKRFFLAFCQMYLAKLMP